MATRKPKAFQLRSLLSHQQGDFAEQDVQESIQSLKARLWNKSLTDGQRHQVRQQLAQLTDRS